jgi:hypothetical protein
MDTVTRGLSQTPTHLCNAIFGHIKPSVQYSVHQTSREVFFRIKTPVHYLAHQNLPYCVWHIDPPSVAADKPLRPRTAVNLFL